MRGKKLCSVIKNILKRKKKSKYSFISSGVRNDNQGAEREERKMWIYDLLILLTMSAGEVKDFDCPNCLAWLMLIGMTVTGGDEDVTADGFLGEWSDQCVHVQEP